ncbi:hypothetical protein H696_01741 [Fonticula alba]|uniref:Non-structural maintenance of chromosomes element 1 homolog n=1 Tax=Fonticula alba TaxID=691883 RepID=A0A058ZEJ8_FONAL|nr:hypothetical protein H696_01741 [Fonticula alba]KCV72348.1 hypothetical protein H696_01741 [Fonticula alba]|eukprot:XP_009493926.1 hypothetical protein H696_01741 [Fonticula alba]
MSPSAAYSLSLDQARQLLVQCLMSQSIFSADQLNRIWAELSLRVSPSSLSGEPAPSLTAILNIANRKLTPLGFRVVNFPSHFDPTTSYYVFANLEDDEFSKKTSLSTMEILYFELVIRRVVESPGCVADRRDLLNVLNDPLPHASTQDATTQGEGSMDGGASAPLPQRLNMTKLEAQNLLNQFIWEEWLSEFSQEAIDGLPSMDVMPTPGMVTLGPRAFVDLKPYLARMYNTPDEPEQQLLFECAVCRGLVGFGLSCRSINCPGRVHLSCAARRPECPACAAPWDTRRPPESPLDA